MQTIGKSIYISHDLWWFVIQIQQRVNSFLSIYDELKKKENVLHILPLPFDKIERRTDFKSRNDEKICF